MVIKKCTYNIYKAALRSFSALLCLLVLFGAVCSPVHGICVAAAEAIAAIPSIPDVILENNRLITTTPVNTRVNLFDYWVHESAESNDWIGNSDRGPNGQYYSSKINKNHPLLVGNGMGYDWTAKAYHHGLWNTTASSWQSKYSANKSWLEGIVKNRLGSDGMPHLNVSENDLLGDPNTADVVKNGFLSEKVYNAWDKNTSLAYLFDPTLENEGKAAFTNVRNLFSLNSGNYRFSSTENYAQFIKDSTVYGSDGHFNVYNTWAVQNGNHGGGTLCRSTPSIRYSAQITTALSSTPDFHVQTISTQHIIPPPHRQAAAETTPA